MSDRIPTSFLNYAAEILADTSNGLSGVKIIEYSNAWAFDCNVDLPHSSYPFNAPNKRTALQQNLSVFVPQDQFNFLLDLCDRLGSPRPPKIEQLRTLIVDRFEQLFVDKRQDKYTPVTSGSPAPRTAGSVPFPRGRPLKVFLCHASDDKPQVRRLYKRLKDKGLDPWLDEENLLAGQNWELEIRHAVKTTDVVLVCLSNSSTTKKGFVQKEIRFALDAADEQPEREIFVIPVRLEVCEVPIRLSKWHWVDEFESIGYERIGQALRERALSLGPEVIEPSLFSNANTAQTRDIVSLDPSLKFLEGWEDVKVLLAKRLQKEFGNAWSVNIVPIHDNIRSEIEDDNVPYPEVILDERHMTYYTLPEPLKKIITPSDMVEVIYDFLLQAVYPDED